MKRWQVIASSAVLGIAAISAIKIQDMAAKKKYQEAHTEVYLAAKLAELKALGRSLEQFEFANAIRRGDLAIVSLLIEAGLDPNEPFSIMEVGGTLLFPDDWASSPIKTAAGSGHPEVVSLLLSLGAKPDLTLEDEAPFRGTMHAGESTESALAAAVSSGNVEIMKMLIKSGAPVNQDRDSSNPVLHVAVKKNQKEMIRPLIDAGADWRAADKFNQYPFEIALENHDWAIAEELIKCGVDVNAIYSKEIAQGSVKYRHTVLSHFTAISEVAVVTFLLAHGANPNIDHGDGVTAFKMAKHLRSQTILNMMSAASLESHK